jgi:hypothetical protein
MHNNSTPDEGQIYEIYVEGNVYLFDTGKAGLAE